MFTQKHSIMPAQWCVYLIHFNEPYKHAKHYLGSTGCLDARLQLHRSGNGARLMEVISDAGVTWQIARIWPCESWKEAHALERKLKGVDPRGHTHPRSTEVCPLCQHKQVDDVTFMKQGHRRFSTFTQCGPRRPMKGAITR